MDKLAAIRIYDGQNYSDEIPITTLAENVQWNQSSTLIDILGSIDLTRKGNIQDQIDELKNRTYSKPIDGIPKADLANSVQISLEKADTALQSYTETDPTVPAWAKQPNKPTYTAQEVGALAIDAQITVEVDNTLSIQGAAADAKKVGNELTQIKQNLVNQQSRAETAQALKINKPVTNPNGTQGQILQTDGQGGTSWVDGVADGQITDIVTDWLDDHVTPGGSTIVVDDMLSIQGAAADAKKVGDEIAAIKKSGTVKASEYLKDILSNMMLLFEAVSLYNDTTDVARIGAETNELIENLEVATLVLTGIDVVFDQTDTIYSNATLNDLKQYLTVTAMYDDGSSRTITSYTLSGTIATGTQTFTVTLGDFTKTFDAVITKAVINYDDYIQYKLPEETVFDGTNVINTGIKPVSVDNDYNWTIMSKVSFDGNDWGKIFFGWTKSTSTYVVRVSVSTATQAGGKKFVYGHNGNEVYGNSLGSSVPSGNHDVAICIVHNANDATTRFVIYYDGIKKEDSTRTEIPYYNDSSLVLYLGSRTSTASFIGTMHDFVMYNTIVDNDTINTYLEG